MEPSATMAGVIFKSNSYLSTHNEGQFGQATDSVRSNRLLSEKPMVVGAAMLSDSISYSLEITAVVLLWCMTYGYMSINIWLVSSIWIIVLVIDALFHEIIYFYSWASHHREFCRLVSSNVSGECCIGSVNLCTHACGPFLRLAPTIGTTYLIVKYTPQLQSVLGSIETPTPLFDLYSFRQTSLSIPNATIFWDLVSMFPTAFFFAFSFISMVLFFMFYLIFYQILGHSIAPVAPPIPEPSLDAENPGRLLLTTSSQDNLPTSAKELNASKTPNYEEISQNSSTDETPENTAQDGEAHRRRNLTLNQDVDQHPVAPNPEFVWPCKNMFLKQALSFENYIFLPLICSLRRQFHEDNVEFFHQLLWNLPSYFVSVTWIELIANAILHFQRVCLHSKFVQTLDNSSLNPLKRTTSSIWWLKMVFLSLGGVLYLTICPKNRSIGLHFFFGLLIVERVFLLIINILYGLKPRYHRDHRWRAA